MYPSVELTQVPGKPPMSPEVAAQPLPTSRPIAGDPQCHLLPAPQREYRQGSPSKPTERNGIGSIAGVCNPNELRRLLARRVVSAGLGSRAGVVILCDLETLDTITERCGVEAGEAALQLTGEAICEATRSVDTVGRLEGGRFAVLVGRAAADQVLAIAARISTVVRSRRLTWQDVSLPIAVSVGIAAYTVGEDPAQLLGRDARDASHAA